MKERAEKVGRMDEKGDRVRGEEGKSAANVQGEEGRKVGERRRRLVELGFRGIRGREGGEGRAWGVAQVFGGKGVQLL